MNMLLKSLISLKLLLISSLSYTVYCKSSNKKLPLVINTWAFREANAAAWQYLNAHRNSPSVLLDALVGGCSTCEHLQCDGTVGFGGSPDERGETRLDAMIMDGESMNIGAVASMPQIKSAIAVAKHVMLNTKHTLLVGDAAADFAVQMGYTKESLATDDSISKWQKWKQQSCQPNFWQNVQPEPLQHCGPYMPLFIDAVRLSSTESTERLEYKFGRYNHDTIGMIVMNEHGIYAGTSTNGANHKIPGRVGDSPIPGAGAYADNEVGAAVATGDGDIMMRFLPSLLAVEALRNGKTPQEASEHAIRRIIRYYKDFSGGLVVADRYGNYSAACAGMDRFPFSVASENEGQSTRVEYVDCIHVQK